MRQVTIGDAAALLGVEAVRELGLEPGSVATALSKATNVPIEDPA